MTSAPALEHNTVHGPAGCRDRYTIGLLRAHGIEAFLSHCLTLTFARRLADPACQKEVFVTSHDRAILDYLPASTGPYTYVSHISDTSDFAKNKHRAHELLETYRERAKLV